MFSPQEFIPSTFKFEGCNVYMKGAYHQPFVMQESFLQSFKSLEPELCITAAYGNILPTKFLRIPSLGKSKACLSEVLFCICCFVTFYAVLHEMEL